MPDMRDRVAPALCLTMVCQSEKVQRHDFRQRAGLNHRIRTAAHLLRAVVAPKLHKSAPS